MEIEKQSADFIPRIKKIVCDHERIDLAILDTKTRKREVVTARQIAMYFSKQYTTASLATIGQEIGGKDHATVLHACKTVENLSDTERPFRGKLYVIQERIELAAGVFDIVDNDKVCINCGSSKVKSKGWIDPNTNELINKIEDAYSNPLDNYCRTCRSHVQLVLRHIFDEDRMEKLENVDTRTSDQITWDDKLESIKQEFEG